MDENLKQVLKLTKASNKTRSVQLIPGQDGGDWTVKLPDEGIVHVDKLTNGMANGKVGAKFDLAYTESEIANGKGFRAVVQGKPVIFEAISFNGVYRSEREVMLKNREQAEKKLAAQIKKWGGVTKTYSAKVDGESVKLPILLEEKFKLTWRQLQAWVAGEVVTNSVEGEEFNHPINRFKFEALNDTDSKAVVKAIEAVQNAAAKELSADVKALLREFLDKDQLTPAQREYVLNLLEEKEELTEQASE